MRSAFSAGLVISRSTQRRNVVLLTIALCLWLLASAMHVHAGDHGELSNPSTACDFCLSLPVGAAPPPAQAQVLPRVPVASVATAFEADAVLSRSVPASYLSRAPPAL